MHRADVEMSLYKYKMQPVYCCCPCFRERKDNYSSRMYALAMKLRSKIKSKDYVKLKTTTTWKWNNLCAASRVVMQRLVWYTESIPARSGCLTKRSLFLLFPKGSKHTYAANSLPVEKRSANGFIHSHKLYLFILQPKWHIEHVFLEIPEIHSLGFQLASHAPPHARSQP